MTCYIEPAPAGTVNPRALIVGAQSLAVRVVARRCRLSPAVAAVVAEHAFGGAA